MILDAAVVSWTLLNVKFACVDELEPVSMFFGFSLFFHSFAEGYCIIGNIGMQHFLRCSFTLALLHPSLNSSHQYLWIQKTSRQSRHMLTDESTKLSRAMFEHQGGQQDQHKDVCVRNSWQKWSKVTSHSWKWVITRNVNLISSSYFRQRYHWHPAQPAGAVLALQRVL